MTAEVAPTTVANSDTSFVGRYGRKFSLSVFGLVLAFLVVLLAMLAATTVPQVANAIAEMVGTFGLLMSVALGAFSGADSLITWKHGGKARSVSTETETTTKTVALEGAPAQRMSGSVPEPGGTS